LPRSRTESSDWEMQRQKKVVRVQCKREPDQMGAELSNRVVLDADVAFGGPDVGFNGALRLIAEPFRWLLQRWYEDVANEDVKQASGSSTGAVLSPKGDDFTYHRAARVTVYRKSGHRTNLNMENEAKDETSEEPDAYLGEWVCRPGQRVLYHPLQPDSQQKQANDKDRRPLHAVVLAVFEYNPTLRGVGSLPFAIIAFTVPLQAEGEDRERVMAVSDIVRETPLSALTPATSCWPWDKGADEGDAEYNPSRWPISTEVYVHVFGHSGVLQTVRAVNARDTRDKETETRNLRLQTTIESWMKEMVDVLPEFVL
jgi:hypothetical protein